MTTPDPSSRQVPPPTPPDPPSRQVPTPPTTPDSPPPSDQVTDSAEAWRRFHPTTPLVRGWAVVVALLVVAMRSVQDFGEINRLASRASTLVGPVLMAVAVVALISFAYALVWWRLARFRIAADAVEMVSGVLYRRRRRLRLDRLQSVDVVQPLFGRLFGLAELRLSSAGGGEDEVRLALLREADATAVRADILARAAGLYNPSPPTSAAEESASVAGAFAASSLAGEGSASSDDGVGGGEPVARGAVPRLAPEAPESILYEVPPARTIGSVLRSATPLWVTLPAVAIVVVVITTHEIGVIFGLVPALLGAASVLRGRLVGEMNFVAAAAQDGLRIRRGLAERTSQTIPPGRVQALGLTQPPLWRGPGWWRIEVNLGRAGTSQPQARQDAVVLPCGPVDEAKRAIWAIWPGLSGPVADAVLAVGLSGSGPAPGLVCAPRRARWLDPIGWRRRAYLWTESALIIRSGRIVRRVVIVPHERTQALTLAQGPWQRRLGLASVAVHSTAGPVWPRVAHLAADDAAGLVAAQSDRARRARRTAGPELWLRSP